MVDRSGTCTPCVPLYSDSVAGISSDGRSSSSSSSGSGVIFRINLSSSLDSSEKEDRCSSDDSVPQELSPLFAGQSFADVMRRNTVMRGSSAVTPDQRTAGTGLHAELQEQNELWERDSYANSVERVMKQYDDEAVSSLDSCNNTSVGRGVSSRTRSSIGGESGPPSSIATRSMLQASRNVSSSTRKLSPAPKKTASSAKSRIERGVVKRTKSLSNKRGDVLARRLKKNMVRKNISEKVQQSWDASNENSKSYERSKELTFKRMLSIMAEHGGPELAELATTRVDDGYGEVPLLVDVLRDCTERKSFLILIDECMKFFIEFAKQENGEEYSTGSMRIMVRRIFAYLKMKYDIAVTESDFPTEGSFRARLSDIWTEEREKNPEFGKAKGKSEICLHDVEYVHDAIRDGILRPDTNAYHLKLVVTFIFLRLFALRSAEVAQLTVADIKWKKYDFGPDRGSNYIEVFVDTTKVNKLKIGNWKTPPNYGKLKIRDNPDDPVFNAYFYLQLYMSKLHPKTKGR